jgi:ribosomal-protein-serine acetyltransferase
MLTILIDQDLKLQLIEEKFAPDIYALVEKNRAHLAQWLPFVNKAVDITFIEQYIQGSQQRFRAGQEVAFVIQYQRCVVGRVGVYRIDRINHVAELGYWLDQSQEGKGLVTRSCSALLRFCFGQLQLNRMEIRTATENHKSNAIAQRLRFIHEGTFREAELLNDKYQAINVHSLLRKEWESYKEAACAVP